MTLDSFLQIVFLLEAYLCIVYTAGSQDKHHNGQEGVLDEKFTSHADNRFRKIEKIDLFEQKGSHSDLEESLKDESDKTGGSPFEVEESDESLTDQMKLLVQKLTSQPEWKEKYEMNAKSEPPEGTDEIVFEHSKDNLKADFSKREMNNIGNNEHEVAKDTYSKSEMAKNNINGKLFHYQIDGECDKHDGACSNEEDKALSGDHDKEVTPVDKYRKENQDINSLEKDRETQLENIDAIHKLEKHDASVSTDQEMFVDKTEVSLIEQLQILEQKVKQQDDWKRVYSNVENLNDYEIAKESQTPVQSVFIVAERTQKSPKGQMKELETKVQQQENQKQSDVVREHMLAKNELGMRDANSFESKESIDEKDLSPSPTAYFSKDDRNFMSEASFVMGNKDEKEMLTSSVLVEDNSPGSLIDQIKILEQKLKSDNDWKREYGNHNNFEDALKERVSQNLNAELEDNFLEFKTSSHNGHKNVETLADKYKREYHNTYHEELHFIEERGRSLIDQMKKLELKIKTNEEWNEVHNKDSNHFENRREQSEIVTSIHASADGSSATGQNSINLVGHKQDGSHYFQKQKRQKCFQTKEYGIPQIDTFERAIHQAMAYEQQEIDRAKQDKEISNFDFGEHMDDVGKSHSMHDQTINSIPHTEAPISDVTPSKTAVINDTGQWISFLQMSCETLAKSTDSKTVTKPVIERSAFMSKSTESSTTQILIHSVPLNDNLLDSLANIGDNHQPTTKYEVKSKSIHVDGMYAEKEMEIVTDGESVDKGNSSTKNHSFPSNILNEDSPNILSTDNSKATQVKIFHHRPYGPSETRTELHTLSETDEDKNNMRTGVGVNTKMPACESMHTIETITDMHTTHTNVEVSTKPTFVNMNTVQTSEDLNTGKFVKNSMQPTGSKDNNAGMNTVQMGSHITTLPEIDSSFSAQIHMQVEPSVNLWYAGTADYERVSQHKEQIEQSTKNYAVNIPVIVLSSLVPDHMSSVSDHLSHTSIDRVSTLEISTSHELLWQPGEAKPLSWGNKYSYFANDALYQSTSEFHQMIASISHTRYSDRNTRAR